ncbi:hypothetical protein AB6D69_02020, partial [Vibrio atlanticus]
ITLYHAVQKTFTKDQHALIDAAETIFYLIKLSEEQRNFEINEHHSYKDYIDVACKLSNVEVQPDVWRMVYVQTGIE